MVYMLLSSSTKLIKSPFGRVPARSKIALALAFLKKASFYTLTRWIRATMFFQRPHQCTVREYLYVTMGQSHLGEYRHTDMPLVTYVIPEIFLPQRLLQVITV